jgi:hypothetical protein
VICQWCSCEIKRADSADYYVAVGGDCDYYFDSFFTCRVNEDGLTLRPHRPSIADVCLEIATLIGSER